MSDRDVKPDNVREAMVVASDGTVRPWREHVELRDGEERERARRLRAVIAAALEQCACSWPVVVAATSTGHDLRCPAHELIDAARAATGARPRRMCKECKVEGSHLIDCSRAGPEILAHRRAAAADLLSGLLSRPPGTVRPLPAEPAAAAAAILALPAPAGPGVGELLSAPARAATSTPAPVQVDLFAALPPATSSPAAPRPSNPVDEEVSDP